jgi:peptidyl-prolyl cis-trans isomerase B (cyclophilin B)
MSSIQLKTNHGNITIKLDEAHAPISSANFIEYVQNGHYNGTIFHRVIPDFMIQGGGMEAGMKQKATRPTIENEANNGLKNVRGSVAMARTSDPHSASSQFFINTVDNDFLNFSAPTRQGWGYAVFGMVTEGLDVVDAIRKVPTTTSGFHSDVPKEDVVIIEAIVL